MRKLASVQKIAWKKPIEGKDRIELCGVLGWSLITKKDEFQVGDKCVYIEIDSVLPEKEEFEFLRSKNFRIKTMKMAGVYSQGICFPLSVLPQDKTWEVGDDVTNVLGVKQYEATMDVDTVVITSTKKKLNWFEKKLMRFGWYRHYVKNINSKCSEEFPTEYVKKTDETRIQSMPWLLENKAEEWIATEKVDGSSGTFLLIREKHKFKKDTYVFKVCSRNRVLPQDDGSAYWAVAKKYNIKEHLKEWLNCEPKGEWVAIQGEVIGPKIQKNKYQVKEPELLVFNLITPQTGRWNSLMAREIVKSMGMKFVPIVDDKYVLPDTVDEILEYATGKSKLGDTLREGIVFRTVDGSQSFKAVSPKFLMKYDE